MKDVINTYGEAVIGMCAVVVAMTMIECLCLRTEIYF